MKFRPGIDLYFNLFIHFFKKSWEHFKNIRKKILIKDLLKNLNY